MAEHRDFDVEVPAAEPAGSFTLGGKKWHVRATSDISLGLAKMLAGDSVPALPFFTATLVPDELDDFIAVMEAPSSPLTQNRLNEVIAFVAAIAMGRPTTPAAGSSTGAKATGRKSTAGSSSRATRQRRSA